MHVSWRCHGLLVSPAFLLPPMPLHCERAEVKWYNNINALYSREVPLQCNTMENRCQTMVIETIIKYHVYQASNSVGRRDVAFSPQFSLFE